MMKFLIAAVAAVGVMNTNTAIEFAFAEIEVRTIFLPINNEECTAEDKQIIFDNVTNSRRRNLVRSLSSSDGAISTYATLCEKHCGAVAPGQCYIFDSRCSDYRRRKLSASIVTTDMERVAETVAVEKKQPNRRRRQLAVSPGLCTKEIKQVEQGLTAATPYVSDECQDVLAGHRDTICFDTDDLCNALSYKLWNTDSQSVAVENFTSGSSFCKSAHSFSVEVVVENCVDKVEFILTGPNSYAHTRIEEVAMYALFGDIRNKNVLGRELEPGSYSMTVRPKAQSSFLAETFFFTIDDC